MFPPSVTVHLYSPASDSLTTFTVRVLLFAILDLGVTRDSEEMPQAPLGQLQLTVELSPATLHSNTTAVPSGIGWVLG